MTGWTSYPGLRPLLGLLALVLAACAPAQTLNGLDRSNYIVSLVRVDATDDARNRLESQRDRVLADVFGRNGFGALSDGTSARPVYGASFVMTHAFEIRLTAEEATRLARHPEVVSVSADTLHRPTRAAAESRG